MIYFAYLVDHPHTQDQGVSHLIWKYIRSIAQATTSADCLFPSQTRCVGRWEAVSSYTGENTTVSAGAWLITLLWHAISSWVSVPQQAIIFSRNNEINSSEIN